MHVALNAMLLSRAQSYRSGGISRVISHLLAEYARDPRGHRFQAFVPEAPRDDGLVATNTFELEEVGPELVQPARRIAWEQTRLPRRLAERRPDLLHGMAYALPMAWPGASVVTIYDLSFLLYPRAFNTVNRVYLAATTRAAARRARRVLTISEHTRRDIVRLLNVPEERVEVTYPAAEERFRVLPVDEVEAFRRARGLPDAFIFAVGTLEPRKNLVGLLEAYASLPQPRPPLYVAGGAGWHVGPIYATVGRLGLGDQVTFLGFVPEDELPLWYNAARLFAFPSLYEGFGLPVLEAMACGTPVITSNAASLPEVGGKAAALVAPRDTAALARALQAIFDDAQVRAEMRAAGRIQATRFSWRAMADRTAAAYVRALLN
ncbi:MAG: glycosyltransferase family 4 protein [Chloroflexota bacterium]|nr:glycosyltransferase family 4 protein [Chloroflexota bacterium]